MLPLSAVLNMYLTGDKPSNYVMLALGWISLGVALTSVTDVQVNFAGCVFAGIAVCCTVLNQVNSSPHPPNSDSDARPRFPIVDVDVVSRE
jgi:hypothetical protein